MVVESSLTEPRRVNGASSGISLKFVTGIFHSQEFERTMGVIGMAFNQYTLHAQIAADAVTFGTKSVPSDSSSVQTSGGFRTASTEALAAEDNGNVYLVVRLFFANELYSVPIYDARNTDFDPATDIDRLDVVLPPYESDWDNEIPNSSLAVVGYTVTHFLSAKKDPSIGFNIQWVIVLGEPDASSD
ncbi:hypothetical protein B0H13DRAFT_1640617 [Mycena leptocephala]|nr:hypothetical protein B0H13DRAFT_1640617 [Mycena leptocephala]